MEHRTAIGIFLALTAQRPVTSLSGRAAALLDSNKGKSTRSAARGVSRLMARPVDVDLVDVDANLLHPALVDDTDYHLQVIFNLCWKIPKTGVS